MTDPSQVVFLVRHGRTTLNADGLLRGLLDPPLDETGLREAEALGQMLGPTGPSAIISTPLQRAQQTASAIASAAQIAYTVDDRLNDRDYGEWSGTKQADVVRRYGTIDDAPGVEDLGLFSSRIIDAFEKNALSADGMNPIVIVAHDAVNRCILRVLIGGGEDEPEFKQPTGCWNRLERFESGWTAPVIGAVPGDGVVP